MLLALLSDTHDNVPATRAALALLHSHTPDVYLHAGDLAAPDMLQHFADLPLHFVFGNNEWDHAEIRSRAKTLNLQCHANFADLEFAGKRLALLHGHEQPLLHSLITAGKHDYIVHGHTHTRRDDRIRSTRVINPGAVHRAKPRSAALLNIATDTLTFLDLPVTA
jgi:putative phosphoesterase